MSTAALPFSLMLITDEAPRLVERVERALEGARPGQVAVQLRNKKAAAGKLLELALTLRELTRRHDALLLINDRVDVAIAAEADGVHLPNASLPADVARRILARHSLVGVSCHSRDDLERAARLGADYATLSPVFAVEGKAPPLGVATFGALAHQVGLPVVALGGISPSDVSALRSAGACGVAVIRAILGANQPGNVTAAFLDALGRQHDGATTR